MATSITCHACERSTSGDCGNHGPFATTQSDTVTLPRAVVEQVVEEGIRDYSKDTGAQRVDCLLCGGVWRPDHAPKHKIGCVLPTLKDALEGQG